MRFVLITLAVAALCASAVASDLVPKVPNSGFENSTTGWGWTSFSAARVSFEIVKKNPHSGKYCMVFQNESPISPNVYGRLATTVNVLPETKYELSCWVRAEDAGKQPGSFHFTDWNTYQLDIPGGTYDWRKVSTTFTSKPGQYAIAIGINIGNTCKALAIDDIVLRPLGGQLQGEGLTGAIMTSPRVIGHDGTASICVLLENSSKTAIALEGAVLIDGKRVTSKRTAIKPGDNEIDWSWNTGKHPFGKYECFVRVVDGYGNVLAKGSGYTEVVDSPVFADLDKIEARKAEFDALYAKCKAKGINLAYPTTTKTMLEQFIPLAQVDVRAGFEYRAKWAVTDFNRSLDESIAAMNMYLEDPSSIPTTRRYVTGGIGIDDLSFIGDRVDSNGNQDRGPLFFCGMGHFTQVRKDIPIFPNYGINIIQIEIGPAHVLTAEGKVDLAAIKEICGQLDKAAKNNVMVNLLVSPHYWPAWAMKKHPELAKGAGGFLGYVVDEKAAKDILEKYLRVIVPMVKDKPALHSLCLTNEPIAPFNQNCDNTKPLWLEYLKKTHGDIATLNKRYGTEYASFEDVPYSGDAQTYDWNRYIQHRFAGWHRWMADIIHEIAPSIPTHAKPMSGEMFPWAVGWGIDYELFGNLLEINGNDCYIFPANGVLDPWQQNTAYDIQRSFARKPIFNSENHIAPDGSNYYIAPEHFYTAMWQGAIHGQGATTIWVWERAFENSQGFIGSVMERPGCARAVGVACTDLNRFAGEVTALETLRAPVAIVYSMSSMIRRGQDHVNATYWSYWGLDFSGVKIDFISEKQLAAGKGSDYKMIIAPDAETLTDAAFEGLRNLPASTRLVTINDCFLRNEYGKKRAPEAIKQVTDKAVALPKGDAEKVIWPAIRTELGKAGALSEYAVVDAATGEPLWNVEWLPAKVGGRTLINMINFDNKPREIKIMRDGKEIEAKNMLSLGGREKVGTLKPITPVLAEIK